MPETNLTKKTRVHYRWSREARALVLANRNASKHELSDLVTQLARMTGNPRFACRRFVSRLGGKWNLAYRSWTLPEEKRLLTLIENHSIADIVKTLRRTRHSIFSKLYELGANANMGRDWFSVYTLAQALHIRHATVQKWIDQGWLIARPIHIGKQRRLVIAADDFCRFCQQRAKDIVGRRLTLARLEFVQTFVFPPSHAELLQVRASKRERAAYESQLGEVEEHAEFEDEEPVVVGLGQTPDRFPPGSEIFPRNQTGEICA